VKAHSDRTGERRVRVAACGALAAVGVASAAKASWPAVALPALAIAAVGLYAFTPPFWSLPTSFLRGDGAAAGIGLINAVGNLGGFIGPYLMGGLRDWSGDFATGLFALAGAAPLSAALVMTARAGAGSDQATTT
jgi:MFS transporter, ACS family, tartrate transporter